MARTKPKFQQIADDLRAGIDTGAYPAGTRLPTREDLAAVYGVATATVSHAMAVLAQQGLVLTGQGFAPMVAGPLTNQGLQGPAETLMPALVTRRMQLNIGQKTVARKIGCSQSQVSDLETGHATHPSLHMYLRYAEAVGVRITWQLQVAKPGEQVGD